MTDTDTGRRAVEAGCTCSDSRIARWQTLSAQCHEALDQIIVHGSTCTAADARQLLSRLNRFDRSAAIVDPVFADAAASVALGAFGPNGAWPRIAMMLRNLPTATVHRLRPDQSVFDALLTEERVDFLHAHTGGL